MPISPNEASRPSEEQKKRLEAAYEVIDNALRRHGGRDVWLNTTLIPGLTSSQKGELIQAYKNAGWKIVEFGSDRDGNYLRISDR